MSRRLTLTDAEIQVLRVALGEIGEDIDQFGLTDEQIAAHQTVTTKLRAKARAAKREADPTPKSMMVGYGHRKIAVEPPFTLQADVPYVFHMDFVRGTVKIEVVSQEEYRRAQADGRRAFRPTDTVTINEIEG